MNKENIENAIYDLLIALGENPQRDGLIETPKRVARMYKEILSGQDTDPATHLHKTFLVNGTSLVLEKDIYFHSLCEHHLLPFWGKAHIAYYPQEKVVGLSKLAKTVETFARRLQIQERMTEQITTALIEHLDTKDVMVVLEAEHMCMSMRGVKKPGTKTITCITKGVFEEVSAEKDAILRMISL